MFSPESVVMFFTGKWKVWGGWIQGFSMKSWKIMSEYFLMYFQQMEVNKQKPKTTKLSDIWWLSVTEAILVGKGKKIC